MLVFLLGATSALLAALALVLYVAGRSRARSLAAEVQTSVEPYLRRKAAEGGLPADAPTWNAHSAPEAVVGYSTRLAVRLLESERTGSGPGEALALAQTQPVLSARDLLLDAGTAAATAKTGRS